jgi:ATP-binding cassette subfamily B protein
LILLRSVSYAQAVQTNYQAWVQQGPWLEQLISDFETLDVDPTAGDVQVDEDLPRRPTIAEPLRITLHDVTFSYGRGRPPALKDVDLEIAPGESVGLVGRSGAGKSTLVQIILGLRSPQKGMVELDSEETHGEPGQNGLRGNVAFVPQDPKLITGSIEDNIRFFRHWLDRAAVEDAVRLVNLAPDVANMPDGLDTIVGEEGSTLSGGQRQRVAIARALAGTPGLLILDEPTSALDIVSEAAITSTLSKLRGTVTTVIIAHRLSTLEHCDRILVLDAGQVVYFGNARDAGDVGRFMGAESARSS